MTASEGTVLDALGGDSADVDTLVARTAMASDVVVAALTDLELAGQVAAIAGRTVAAPASRMNGPSPSRAHARASRTRARWAA